MSQSFQSSPGLQDFFFTFLVHPVRWLAPTVLIAAAALVYAISTPKQWRATQAIAVRNDAGAQPASLGSFDSIDEMQAYQETVMELARSRAVVSAALTDVGPTESMNSTEMFPSKEQIEKLQSAISSRAPNGAELGRTEVFYLQVKDRQPERAKRLVAAVCNRLDEQFQDLRRRKAESLSSELEKNVHLTQDTLRDVTGRLTGVEQQVGPDLAELQLLSESSHGEGNLRRSLIENQNRRMQQLEEVGTLQELLKLLRDAVQDSSQLIALPNRLLQTQPEVQRLKDGLVDSQLRTATLRGMMTHTHPKVQEAVAAEREIRAHLSNELEHAVAGVMAEPRVVRARVRTLDQQLAELTSRKNRLVAMRAEYANLIAESRHSTTILESAQTELANSRASQSAALAASVLTRLDGPQIGNHPLGPRRAHILLAGVAGGFLTGLGIVFLTAQPSTIAAGTPLSETLEPVTERPRVRPAPQGTGLSFGDALEAVMYGAPSRN